jgi:hypothetical protein
MMDQRKDHNLYFGEITMFFSRHVNIDGAYFCLSDLNSNINIDKEVVKAMDFNKDGEPKGLMKNGHNFKPPS